MQALHALACAVLVLGVLALAAGHGVAVSAVTALSLPHEGCWPESPSDLASDGEPVLVFVCGHSPGAPLHGAPYGETVRR